MAEKKILLIEDDRRVANDIVQHFSELGLTVVHSERGDEGYSSALQTDYALLIVDIALPGKNGFDICRDLRAQRPLLPILLLTTRNAEVDRVLGFELGADDFVTKPFSMSELLARVRRKLRLAADFSNAQIQSGAAGKEDIVEIGELTLDAARCLVYRRGEELALTAKEFELLSFLMHRPGRVFSKYDLLESVWKVDSSVYEEAVISMVKRLRSKIEDDPSRPVYLLNTRGMGYSFIEPEKFPAFKPGPLK